LHFTKEINTGQLFAQYFLEDGICQTENWKDCTAQIIDSFRSKIEPIFKGFLKVTNPSESQTEVELILPILKNLGWEHYLTQVNMASKGKGHTLDILLFLDETAKNKADAETKSSNKLHHGIIICENKRWEVPLDRTSDKLRGTGTPSTQILHYLSDAEVKSNGRIIWGI